MSSISLESIRSILERFEASSIRSHDLKAALKVIIFTEPQPSDEECLEILRLFHSKHFIMKIF